MFSYRHGFHAGNVADVHKHWLLLQLLAHLRAKDKPFCVIDTHAGDGRYDLMSEAARKTGEYHAGIGRLWPAAGLPESLAAYRAQVAAHNPGGSLRWYPGSPLLIRDGLRPQDRAVLLEAHPTAWQALHATMAERGRISVQQRDAFEGLPALLPPAERRGLVLVDPSYEVKTEYRRLGDLLATAWRRWPQGIYAVWFPLLAEGRHRALCRALAALDAGSLYSELRLLAPSAGLLGSGVMILNPPWLLAERLAAEGPALAALLVARWQSGVGAGPAV